jgi:hypothetical protein
MTGMRASEADEAVALIRQAMENVEHRQRPLQESVTTNGMVMVLNDAVRGIEGPGAEEGD